MLIIISNSITITFRFITDTMEAKKTSCCPAVPSALPVKDVVLWFMVYHKRHGIFKAYRR